MSSMRTVYLNRSTDATLNPERASIIARGKDGRYYVLYDRTHWLCSFPTEAAAWQWLSTLPARTADGRPDIEADDRWFEALGGEWPNEPPDGLIG